MSEVLVFGHRNPDNDSIGSAVAYAHLKNMTDPSRAYLPARLGEPPVETVWTFARFGVEMPEVVGHVRVRVADVMAPEPVSVLPDDTLLVAGRVMAERGLRSLPVVDGGQRPLGVVTAEALAGRYLADLRAPGFARRPITVARLAEVVGGRVVEGDPGTQLDASVRIAASEPETAAAAIMPGDLVIVGDRVRTQPLAIEAGAACLLVTNGAVPVPAAIEAARERGAAIVVTDHDTHGASRLVELAHAVAEVMGSYPVTAHGDDLLAEVAGPILDSPVRTAPVVDDDGHLIGVVTRTDLARARAREVILVDHNETAQSVAGIEDASVIEVVDHHRIGDVQTAGPIAFFAWPVGATATIVAERYRELGVEVPEPMAGILLSAILSDTVLFKSPTTTRLDIDVAARLSSIVGVEPEEFGMDLFRAKTAATPFSAQAVVGADFKRFDSGGLSMGIGQHETVDAEGVLSHVDELAAEIERVREHDGYDLTVLLVTDVTREGSWLMARGATELADRALGIEGLGATPIWAPGLLSRKKQVAAPLVEAASRGRAGA